VLLQQAAMESVEAALGTPQSVPPPIMLEMILFHRKEIVQILESLHISHLKKNN